MSVSIVSSTLLSVEQRVIRLNSGQIKFGELTTERIQEIISEATYIMEYKFLTYINSSEYLVHVTYC